MIVPCIDLMDGKVVQLVQGREKALEGDSPDEMLRKFAAFPEIQVIDLDAALAASIFHYGTYTVNQLKEELDKRGIPVRVTA
jgi:imidazole glycerol phosphate synthase subunit HisF